MPSLFEHQIHQNIVYTGNWRYSIHINKNSSIGLQNIFTVWCRNNRRSSTCTTNPDVREVSNVGYVAYQLVSLCHI